MAAESDIIDAEQLLSQKEKKPRKKVTIDTHMEKYALVLQMLDEEIERKQKAREPGIRTLQRIRGKVDELHCEVVKVAKIKRKNPNSKKVSGFSLECKITKELAEFMKIPEDSTPTRNDITNAICVYAHFNPAEKKPQVLKWKHLNPEGKRNLQDPKNKMYIIPDAKLKKLLNYDAYVKDVKEGKITRKTINKETGKRETITVDDTGLSYSVIQKLIQTQILKTVTTKFSAGDPQDSQEEDDKAEFEILA